MTLSIKVIFVLKLKNMKFLRLFTLLFLSVYFASCSNDNDTSTIHSSTTFIQMEGEGGSTDVSFIGGDWRITGVTNKNGNVKINGDSYSFDDELIRKNYILSLEGLGRMEAFGGSKGFIITRDSPTSLNIELKENSSGENFNFTIDLQSESESKKITVKQKKSQGYSFESIEYTMNENDGDSLFVRNGTGYKFNIPSPQNFSFSPFTGIGISRETYFKSNEKDAFVWFENNSIKVKVPSFIDNEKIYTAEEKEVYTNLTTVFPHGFKQMETVTVPSGKSVFSTQIQFRKRTVSYTLDLTNKRTGDKKIIDGKWIEIAPTGKYDIKWMD